VLGTAYCEDSSLLVKGHEPSMPMHLDTPAPSEVDGAPPPPSAVEGRKEGRPAPPAADGPASAAMDGWMMMVRGGGGGQASKLQCGPRTQTPFVAGGGDSKYKTFRLTNEALPQPNHKPHLLQPTAAARRYRSLPPAPRRHLRFSQFCVRKSTPVAPKRPCGPVSASLERHHAKNAACITDAPLASSSSSADSSVMSARNSASWACVR
jgi:hypothetical protein